MAKAQKVRHARGPADGKRSAKVFGDCIAADDFVFYRHREDVGLDDMLNGLHPDRTIIIAFYSCSPSPKYLFYLSDHLNIANSFFRIRRCETLNNSCVKDCIGQANHVYVIVKPIVNVSNVSPFVIERGTTSLRLQDVQARVMCFFDAVAKYKQLSKLNEFKRGHTFQISMIQIIMDILIAIHVYLAIASSCN